MPLDGPWYDPVPVGRNKLGSMVKEMCEDAGIAPRTNHSLRATGATALFHADVPERIIQKTTGHRSLDSLRTYERISTKQQEAVSRVMMSTQSTSFADEFQKVSSHHIAATPGLESVASVGTVFRDFINCSVGKITINVNPNVQPTIIIWQDEDEKYDEIVKSMNLDIS